MVAGAGLWVTPLGPAKDVADAVRDHGRRRSQRRRAPRERVGLLASLARRRGWLEAIHQPITCQPTAVVDVTALLR